jgi:hypothetical protein
MPVTVLQQMIREKTVLRFGKKSKQITISRSLYRKKINFFEHTFIKDDRYWLPSNHWSLEWLKNSLSVAEGFGYRCCKNSLIILIQETKQLKIPYTSFDRVLTKQLSNYSKIIPDVCVCDSSGSDLQAGSGHTVYGHHRNVVLIYKP